MKYHATIVLALIAASCTRPPPPTERMPAGLERSLRSFLRKASEKEVQSHATDLAAEHVHNGTPYVAWCGTVGLYRPGVAAEKKHLVAHLPALNLPSGCRDPLAIKGAWFALAYNAELLKRLSCVPATPPATPMQAPS
jgi:hypothetical protein